VPASSVPPDEADIRRELARLLEQGLGTREAAARIAEQYGISRRGAYRLALDVAGDSPS
jgi:hypothetical protein